MTEEQKEILEWLIEYISFTNKRELFDNEHKKEITIEQEVMEIFGLEEIDYKGRKLIRRESTSIYFYPLAIRNYLNE